jgi:hypothetical protein
MYKYSHRSGRPPAFIAYSHLIICYNYNSTEKEKRSKQPRETRQWRVRAKLVQVLGPQKERNINARTGSSAAPPLAASALPSARRDVSAAGALLGPHDAGDAAASLASRHAMRLIRCLRLMAYGYS